MDFDDGGRRSRPTRDGAPIALQRARQLATVVRARADEGQPPLVFDWSHAPPGALAYDIVTDPVETAFLAAARAARHKTIDGLAMLIGQAASAFERFFGVSPPREHDAELRALLLQ